MQDRDPETLVCWTGKDVSLTLRLFPEGREDPGLAPHSACHKPGGMLAPPTDLEEEVAKATSKLDLA